jgi:uracil permease
MAVTKVYSVRIIGWAAIFSIILAFIWKASALIQTIPSPVMWWISFLLYWMIAASGLRLLVDKKVDYGRPRNLALTSIVLVTWLSGAFIQIGEVQLKWMCLAALVWMVFGTIFYVIDKLKMANDLEN